jgi:hypothetical protein
MRRRPARPNDVTNCAERTAPRSRAQVKASPPPAERMVGPTKPDEMACAARVAPATVVRTASALLRPGAVSPENARCRHTGDSPPPPLPSRPGKGGEAKAAEFSRNLVRSLQRGGPSGASVSGAPPGCSRQESASNRGHLRFWDFPRPARLSGGAERRSAQTPVAARPPQLLCTQDAVARAPRSQRGTRACLTAHAVQGKQPGRPAGPEAQRGRPALAPRGARSGCAASRPP